MKKILLFLLLLISSLSAETVFTIHGFMRKPSSMKKMAKTFENGGYTVRNWGYPSKRGRIQDHGEALVQELSQVADARSGEPIHFVTHSLGGIILRSALNHPDCPQEAKMGRAVMLAPPNKGARFGRFLRHFAPIRSFFGPYAGKQILLSDDFDYIGQMPDSVDVLVISGTCGFNPVADEKNDGKVGVSECCLDTPHKHMEHFSGHSWMMYNKTVIYNAKRFIEGG